MGRKLLKGINIAAVARTLGILVLFEAAFMLVPTGAALIAGEFDTAKAFGISAIVTGLCGWLTYSSIRTQSRHMGRRESVFLTASVWIIFSLFGQIPYMLDPSTRLSFSAAFLRR